MPTPAILISVAATLSASVTVSPAPPLKLIAASSFVVIPIVPDTLDVPAKFTVPFAPPVLSIDPVKSALSAKLIVPALFAKSMSFVVVTSPAKLIVPAAVKSISSTATVDPKAEVPVPSIEIVFNVFVAPIAPEIVDVLPPADSKDKLPAPSAPDVLLIAPVKFAPSASSIAPSPPKLKFATTLSAKSYVVVLLVEIVVAATVPLNWKVPVPS